MKINCLCCGLSVDLDDAYDDYEGLVKCFACKTLSEIRVAQGQLKAVKLVNTVPGPSPAQSLVENPVNPEFAR